MGMHKGTLRSSSFVNNRRSLLLPDASDQWFPTGEEFLPSEEFHESRGGVSTIAAFLF